MVPGSTFRYGSNFIMLTRSPRLSSRQPIDAAARPLPKLDTTPPVTKTYFADIDATSRLDCWDWTYLVGTVKYGRKSPRIKTQNRICASSRQLAHTNLLDISSLRRPSPSASNALPRPECGKRAQLNPLAVALAAVLPPAYHAGDRNPP